jgi:putative hydrolase of the HAD superfamily
VVELVPAPNVCQTLERLAAERIALAAISNAAFSGRVLGAELARHGLGKYLQFVISSGDVGTRKPAPGIYDLALNRLGVPARKAWFVGDTEEEDLVGAEAVGLMPLLFNAFAQSISPATGRRVVHSWPEFLELFTETT